MGTLPTHEYTDTVTVAFPESLYCAPNFPLGKGLAGPFSVCLGLNQGGSLSFLNCKMGTSSASVWSRNKRSARNGGFLALPESCVSHLCLSSIKDQICPMYFHTLSSWHSAWHIVGT